MVNRIYCIAREFGSGGHDIGKALAQQLDIPFYDKGLLHLAAQKSGLLQELFERTDERPASGAAASGEKAESYEEYIAYMPNDRIQQALAETIADVAAKSSCVIIGRCADYVLRGKPGVISTFIHAPLEARIQRVARLHNTDEDHARQLIRKADRNRGNYYSYYTNRDWGRAANYHLTLDSFQFRVEGSVALLASAGELLWP